MTGFGANMDSKEFKFNLIFASDILEKMNELNV